MATAASRPQVPVLPLPCSPTAFTPFTRSALIRTLMASDWNSRGSDILWRAVGDNWIESKDCTVLNRTGTKYEAHIRIHSLTSLRHVWPRAGDIGNFCFLHPFKLKSLMPTFPNLRSQFSNFLNKSGSSRSFTCSLTPSGPEQESEPRVGGREMDFRNNFKR